MTVATLDLAPPLTIDLPPVTAAPHTARDEKREAGEALVARAEAAVDSHDYAGAVDALADTESSLAAFPTLALRALFAQSWALMSLGQIADAVSILDRARSLAERPCFTDVQRADVLYRLGCCRFSLTSTANALALFTLALELCDRAPVTCDRLRARIFDWRSRCYQRHRDWEAARADVERGLELSERCGDDETAACLYFQASIVAEREAQLVLARFYAEHALKLYASAGDRLNVHKVLNNLGGIAFLLGEHERSVECLKESFAIALDLGSDVGAAYAMSSLAQVQLRTGDAAQAETHARRALELLAGRVDHLNEIGNAQLVLGRALLEQGRCGDAEEAFAAADVSFDRLGSASHRAAARIAQGDLAARTGDTDTAARLYREAAETLQDFRF